MHRHAARIALFLAALTAALPLAAQTLRVMSFNVRTLAADDGANGWEHRRDLMVRTIREQHPDVMGTQELFKQQGDYLVAKLPGYTWFGIGRYGDERDEHMGVFYRRDRLKLLDSGSFWLSDTPDKPGSISWGHPLPRLVTWAKFEDRANSRHFYFYNTHFPYREQDVMARTRAAHEIAARIEKLPEGMPVVLTGDFNTTAASPAYVTLTRPLHDARTLSPHPVGPEATFHDFTGIARERIDWILERGFTPQAYATLTTHEGKRYPSDHFPVATKLAWKPAR